MVFEAGVDFLEAVFGGGCVFVGAEGADAGDEGLEGFFDLLGADADVFNFATVAFAAFGGDVFKLAAEMALEEFFVGGVVEGEADVAVLAFFNMATFKTLDAAAKAAAIEEKDDLFLGFEGFLYCLA